jgi:uncharacterized protein
MLAPTLVMLGVALALVIWGWQRGQGEHLAGLTGAWNLTLQVLPLLLAAFVVAGMVQVLVPQGFVARWVGAESGWRGIWLGALAGGLTPGGPYVSLPIVLVLTRGGAGIGTVVAFLTGWSLWAFGRIPMEVGIIGWRLTLIRLATTAVFPPLAGWLAQQLFGRGGGA